MTAALAAARSFLFVPGDVERRIARALRSEADAVILDLEDAVAPERKDDARRTVAEALATPRPENAPLVLVRVDDPADDDLAMLAKTAAPPAAIVVPKASAASLDRAARADLPLVALVETPAGLLDARALAAHPAVARLQLGFEDLSLALGLPPGADTTPMLDHARATLALASAAAGLPGPIDAVSTRLDDPDGLAAECRRARALGVHAKACIHPRQLGTVNAAMAPGDEEVAWARRVLDAAAAAGGAGAVSAGGDLVDRPIVERARRILAARPPAAPDKESP